MVKISDNDLRGLVPSSSANQPVPPIFNTIREIIKGVNEMLGSYKELTGKKAYPADLLKLGQSDKIPIMDNSSIPSFGEARVAKKLQIKSQKQFLEREVVPDEFGDLLRGFIMACDTLETMGFGDKTIGEALTELPFTVAQSKEFLIQMAGKRGM